MYNCSKIINPLGLQGQVGVGVRIDKLPVDQEIIAREIWEREEQ